MRLANLLHDDDNDNNNNTTRMARQLFQNYDALILGTDVGVATRRVTPGTYEQTPNDVTTELYWPAPAHSQKNPPPQEKKQSPGQQIIKNVLQAAAQAGVRHVCLVDDNNDANNHNDKDSILAFLQTLDLPYTCLQPQASTITITPNYTYRKGVQQVLRVVEAKQNDHEIDNNNNNNNNNETVLLPPPIYREDLCALAVQCLLTLDWTTSRVLHVRSSGQPVTDAQSLLLSNQKPLLRPDQEWCVNSVLLEQALAGVV